MSGSIQLLSDADFTSLQVAAAQANSRVPLNVTVGSVDLAGFEANTGIALFLQAAIVKVLLITRAATSTGADLDSWFADFSFPRLQPDAATGTATAARSNTTTAVSIKCDGTATVVLPDGSETYTVVANQALPAYNLSTNSYVMQIGEASITIGITAQTAGTAGNLPIGTALFTGTNVNGVDTIVVAGGMANGLDLESDQAYRDRFPPFINSLSRATLASIGSAILDTQQGIQFTIANNQDTQGNFEPGNFVVTIDDGSGNPPDSLIQAVDQQVSLYQGNTISHNTRGPTVIQLTVAFDTTLSLPTGVIAATANAQTTASVLAYVNAQLLGQTPFSLAQLSARILASSPYVTNVTNLHVDGDVVDIIVAPNQVVKLTAGNLSVGNT